MEVAPCACEYWPARHCVHASEPRIVLYVPPAQRVHGGDPPVVAVKPTLHWHALAPVLDQVSLAQVWHGVEPGISLYSPATQGAHGVNMVPPPLVPALHRQSDKESLPSAELEFDGHASQLDNRCTSLLINVPAWQGTQSYSVQTSSLLFFKVSCLY
jgi:hypothetical protein